MPMSPLQSFRSLSDSNLRRLDCLLNRLFRRRSKLRVTGIFKESTGDLWKSIPDRWIPLTKEQSRRNISIWWRYHLCKLFSSLRMCACCCIMRSSIQTLTVIFLSRVNIQSEDLRIHIDWTWFTVIHNYVISPSWEKMISNCVYGLS